MTTVLFTYRRQAKDTEGNVIQNVNFINPFHIISMFWETTDTGKRLNVFLVNGKPIIFSETMGKKLVTHVEDALRFSIFGHTTPNTAPTAYASTRVRREPMVAEVVEDDLTTETADFV